MQTVNRNLMDLLETTSTPKTILKQFGVPDTKYLITPAVGSWKRAHRHIKLHNIIEPKILHPIDAQQLRPLRASCCYNLHV